jgi:Helicase conserved C-terminal domain
VEYADRLRTLARPDLEQLLARRPETSALTGRGAADYDDLAAILALPAGVVRAAASLDRFHLQVLDLAFAAGGTVEPAFAEAQGLEPPLLAPAGAELARWGLGFPDGAGGLWVPPAVVGVLDPGARAGSRAGQLLREQPVGHLWTIAGVLGAARMDARKEDLVALIDERLRDRELVRSLVAGAPEVAATVLRALRAGGGRRHWYELVAEVPGVASERGLWQGPLRPADDGIGWLRARALVVCVSWSRTLFVPAEVELALRGRLFATWEPEPPPLELAPLESDRHPAELVTEVDGLLDLWREPVTLLQSGDLGVRECSRAATAIGAPEGAVRFLASLAISAGLLSVQRPPQSRATRSSRRAAKPQPGRLVLNEHAAADWRAGAIAERWAALVGRWRVALRETETGIARIVDELGALPPGQGASPASLARRLAWRYPAIFLDAEAAMSDITSAVATLHRLGVGGGAAGPVAGVSDLGRTALRGARPERLAPLFPPMETTCTITADLRIVVAGPPEPELARTLSAMAELEAASPARVYRLTEASLRRALDAGSSAAGLADFLGARCPTGVPQNVAALIEDVGRRYGRLRVGRAAVYLHGDDPALVAEVAANRRLRGLQVRLLAPTVAVVEGADERQALEALRRAGYMPAADGEPPAPRRAAGRRRPPPAPPAEPAAPDVRGLADRLLAGPRPARPAPGVRVVAPDDDALRSGVRVTAPADVERLLRLAVAGGLVVEIEYRNGQSASVTRRTIEPRLAGDRGVVGWCRLRQDDRSFAFAGVRWARATGEAVQQRQVGLGADGP